MSKISCRNRYRDSRRGREGGDEFVEVPQLLLQLQPGLVRQRFLFGLASRGLVLAGVEVEDLEMLKCEL
jgi:hypothetical protein